MARIPDLRIRPAEPADALNVARVHVRSWQEGYRDLMSAAFLQSLSIEERARRYTFASLDPAAPLTWVAEENDSICGFATTVGARDADAASSGELAALYVHPDRWGQGIGRALITAARAHLKAAGFQHALLWVLSGNLRAERFYRQDGWAADGHSRRGERGGLEIEERRFRRAL